MFINEKEVSGDALGDLFGSLIGGVTTAVSSVASKAGDIVMSGIGGTTAEKIAQLQAEADLKSLDVQKELAELKTLSTQAETEKATELAKQETLQKEITLKYIIAGTSIVVVAGIGIFFGVKFLKKKKG